MQRHHRLANVVQGVKDNKSEKAGMLRRSAFAYGCICEAGRLEHGFADIVGGLDVDFGVGGVAAPGLGCVVLLGDFSGSPFYIVYLCYLRKK